MSCAACQARVENAVNKVPGVTSCAVSLLTNSMGVEGTAAPEDIIKAVEKAGYGARRKASTTGSASSGGNASKAYYESIENAKEALEDRETPALKRRLVSSIGFLLVLMYFSMGHMMWGWPIPAWFEGNHVAMGLVQMILATIIMIINRKFFINGFRGLVNRSPNMDTLVALGSGVSFVWSVYVLFLMTDAVVKADDALVMKYMDQFYFESAAMILTLITVGKMLEARSKGKTTDALRSLMTLTPKTAVVVRDGIETTVAIDEVAAGDIFVVRPGEAIPVDGIVTEGNAAVDESALTGESIPVDKEAGSSVSAATINRSGYIQCRATRVGEDTTLSQIVKMMSDAAATKAPIAKIADRVSGIFVPAVISIAAVTFIIWLILGADFAYALERGISVLVISCPCALGLATPVAIMVGNGVGARAGILFKTALSLENAGKTEIVALDKTGTITNGRPVVTDIITAEGVSEEELLSFAYALEAKSEHPLAKAITDYVTDPVDLNLSDFENIPGKGLTGKVQLTESMTVRGGKEAFIVEACDIPEGIKVKAYDLAEQGKTPLYFSAGSILLGMIAVADTIKEDSAEAVKQFKELGIRVVMITGDNERTAAAIAKEAGVDEVIAGVLPDGKAAAVESLKAKGRVMMVGDGINDAPALVSADTGMAIGAGTDVAIDAADIVLVKSRLTDAVAAVRLSRKTLANIHQNLFWAFFYNILGIPLAAGVYTALLGWSLNPMFGAAAMSLSSFCVVTNALRLNFARIYR